MFRIKFSWTNTAPVCCLFLLYLDFFWTLLFFVRGGPRAFIYSPRVPPVLRPHEGWTLAGPVNTLILCVFGHSVVDSFGILVHVTDARFSQRVKTQMDQNEPISWPLHRYAWTICACRSVCYRQASALRCHLFQEHCFSDVLCFVHFFSSGFMLWTLTRWLRPSWGSWWDMLLGRIIFLTVWKWPHNFFFFLYHIVWWRSHDQIVCPVFYSQGTRLARIS